MTRDFACAFSAVRKFALFGIIRTLLVAAATLTAAAGTSGITGAASAQSIYASDCGFGFKNVYQDNEPVCAVVSPAIGIFGSAHVCVVPPGTAVSPGPSGADVTAGGCNAVGFGASVQELFVWLPPTTQGTYDIVVTNNSFGQARDTIIINSSGGAAPTINVQAIKDAAGVQAQSWNRLATFGANLSAAADAVSLAYHLATGNVVGAATAAFGLVTGIPTDYNGGVLTIGGNIINRIALGQAAAYATLQADPPDPNFTDFASVDLDAVNSELAANSALFRNFPTPAYPFDALSADPLHASQIALANSIAQEQALVLAFMRTLEKYQGADEADDDEFRVLQAQALIDYAEQLKAQTTKTRDAATAHKTEQANAGLASATYDGAALQSLYSRLQSTGLTPAEEAELRALGFTDDELLLIVERATALPVPAETFSRGSALDEVIATSNAFISQLDTTIVEATDVIDYYDDNVLITHPTADAGGPYAALEGQSFSLDGTGSTDPASGALTYEWDLDLDGAFDDAVGATPSVSFDTPGATQVGLKVTNANSEENIAYADVSISEANSPPAITAYAPADLTPDASPLSPVTFTASATDPDGDSLSYSWSVDGVPAGSGMSFAFTPVTSSGVATIQVTVSDGSPLSADAVNSWTAQLFAEVFVPDVVGQAQAAAEAAITGAGLTVGAVTTQSSDTVPSGSVISQSPVGGSKATPGDAVSLVVSTGPAPVTVPDVVGLTQGAAEAAITGAGLTVGSVSTQSSDTVPSGAVISQTPIGGASALPGDAVSLVVSTGPAPVTVPGVVGQTQAAAEAAITGAGLVVGTVTTQSSDTVPSGSVISQSPAGGASAFAGDSVSLVVSTGPAAVTVPDVVGLTQGAAEAAITGAGLTVGAVTTQSSDTVPSGSVISQSPSGGASALPGDAVSLVVSTGPAAVTVPDVVGLTQGAAEAAITGAGLTVGAVTTQSSDTVPSGSVISQSPAGGASALPGDAVSLVVSTGPAAPALGDVDGDGDVDRNDILLISAARNQPASGPNDPRDIDGDGVITVLDIRAASTLCTRSRCAVG